MQNKFVIESHRHFFIDEKNLQKFSYQRAYICLVILHDNFFFFFYLGFLSRTFTIHGTAGEGGGYLFNSSLPLPPASQTLRY